jgi:6-phosphogluconate dehydrogenase
MILDTAHQKGTGMWVSQDAMELQIPVPSIDAAVSARDLSALKKERMAASANIFGPVKNFIEERIVFLKELEQALYFAMITTYAQGFSLLNAASKQYGYHLNLDEVAKIWRGGCIIRASVLENIRIAFSGDPGLTNLMMNPVMAEKLMRSQDNIRQVVSTGVETGITVPVFMASLAYFDGYRSAWLPSNLVQAQRDYFGAHTYQRTDREGDFHT